MQVWITILAGPILLFGERFPSPLVLLALAAILLPWVARLISRGRLFRPTPLDLPVLAMFLMVPLGLYASVDLELSLPLVGQLLVGASLFYGLANETKPKVHPGWLAFLFVFGAAGLTLIESQRPDWPCGPSTAKVKGFSLQILSAGMTLSDEILQPSPYNRAP